MYCIPLAVRLVLGPGVSSWQTVASIASIASKQRTYAKAFYSVEWQAYMLAVRLPAHARNWRTESARDHPAKPTAFMHLDGQDKEAARVGCLPSWH